MSLENVLLNQNAFLVDVAQMLNVFSGATTKKIAYACQGLNFETMNVLMSMNVQMDHTNVAMPPVSIWKAHIVAPLRWMLFGLLMEQDLIKEMSRLHNKILSSKEIISWHKTPKKQDRLQIEIFFDLEFFVSRTLDFNRLKAFNSEWDLHFGPIDFSK